MLPYRDGGDRFSPGFKLNMRLVADLLAADGKIDYYAAGDSCCLVDASLYYPGCKMEKDLVYFAKREELPRRLDFLAGHSFVIIGQVEVGSLPAQSPIIVIEEKGADLLEIYSRAQEGFRRFRQWDWRLQEALAKEKPLDEILLATMEIIKNPMFIHDKNFLILSDPKHSPKMTEWEKDPRSGMPIASMALINDFRTDVEYIRGLKEKEPVLFSPNQTGYAILFRNLWKDGYYMGRLLVDEIDSKLRPGDSVILDYLGKMIEYFVENRHLVWLNSDSDLEKFFTGFLDAGTAEVQQMQSKLQVMNWKRDDRYVCMKIVSDQKEFNLISSTAILGQIENQISSGRAFYYDKSIAVVVNLSYQNEAVAEVISKLAVLMRESLLKIGVSTEFQDFTRMPKAYTQAKIALAYGQASDSMIWYYHFEDYILDYIVGCGEETLPADMLCSSALSKLKAYDRDNNTDLYQTLRIHLRNERNVLQTSKTLFIHRSTLFYRLQKIQKIINVDLDDPKERLKLLFSYYIEWGNFDQLTWKSSSSRN